MNFLDLCAKPSVGCKAETSAESHEEVIQPQRAADADREDGEQKVKHNERGLRDVLAGIRKAKDTIGKIADE